jgi:hypothetical protein
MLVVLRHMLLVASPGCQWRERLWALLDAHRAVSLDAMNPQYLTPAVVATVRWRSGWRAALIDPPCLLLRPTR